MTSRRMKPLQSAAELTAAYKQFAGALRRRAKGPFRRNVGWQGGNSDLNGFYFREDHGFWFLLADSVSSSDDRRWCGFGTNVRDDAVLNIVCEINPPRKGIYRRTAGLFLRDTSGNLYIAHSGKIGGGKKGIGQTAFLRSYRGRRVKVEWPDGDVSTALLLSHLSDKNLPRRIAEFVHAVERFKNRHTSRQAPTPEEKSIVSFKPEFSRSYKSRVSWSGRIRKLHGLVVNTLSRKLEMMGYRVANDKHRDLFLAAKQKRTRILFEAKTGVGSTDIYTGVGQLLINGSASPKASKLVLVLPRHPHKKTCDVLEELGILTLLFYRQGREIRFRNLADVLRG